MNVLILAAGIGRRLGNIGKNIPKCLLEIEGSTVLEWQLRALLESGINLDDIHLVVGKQGKCWTEKNLEIARSTSVHLIINSKNIELSQSYSFFIGIKNLSDDNLLVIDGDLLIDAETIISVIDHKRNTILLTHAPRSKSEPGNKVYLDSNGKILGVSRETSSDSYTIYSGIFNVSKTDIIPFKKELRIISHYKNDLGFVFDAICKKITLHNLTRDPAPININTLDSFKRARKGMI